MVRRSIRVLMLSLFAVAPASAAEPGPLPKSLTAPGAAVAGHATTRVVAYIHGNVPISRDELGDFLIARGGADKLELLVNKRIVEAEARRRGVSVMPKEIEAALNEDLKGVQQKEVVTMILRQYGKTLVEWREDVVRPRLLLGKMVRENLQASEEEIRRAHEMQYGEKRQARVIEWPKQGSEARSPSAELVAAIRGSDAEFEKSAGNQADARLAESRGLIMPVSRFTPAKDTKAITTLFALSTGQTSELLETATSWMIVKCVSILPPDAAHSLEKPIVRAELEREVVDRKISEAIPKLFDSLKAEYKANVIARAPSDVKQANFSAPLPPLPPGGPEQVLATLSGPDSALTITRADLGEYLIYYKGAEALELLANRRIVQMEAAKRNVSFSQEEVDAAFDEMVKAAGPTMTKEVFVEKVLPARKLSLYEYIEDVVKPDIVLRKMVRDRVKVSEADLMKAFERKYGEKRACEIIIWRKGEERVALNEWNAIKSKQKTFDQVARMQADPNLAAAAGRVPPIGRHIEADDPIIEKVVFDLPVGDMSHLLQTRAGTMCIRNSGIVPPVPGAKFEDVRPQLEREEFEKLVTKEIPVFFGELKKTAAPSLLLQTGMTILNSERVREDANDALKKK